MIWTGCASGLLIQWDGNGSCLQDVQYLPFPVQCLCLFGLRIWVGYGNGNIQRLDPKFVGSSQRSSDYRLTIGAGHVFSLANRGKIGCSNVTSPGPLDSILRTELGTWNVGQGRASHDPLIAWLGSAAPLAGIVVVWLQEVEMGAGFLAVSAAKETKIDRKGGVRAANHRGHRRPLLVSATLVEGLRSPVGGPSTRID
ncbi:hypothetical protein CRG98_022394 [Punica granatum]|uniref:IP5PC-F beta-propeller domain-containing protein n=1 Tax=Punica granatum TaxID=22663 RepID=A0A2I0JLQ3_PUNGR|nr:hypothetical protein CRG98_022394 [Punica granatum]